MDYLLVTHKHLASAGIGDCKVLRYHGGYANLTTFYDKIIKDSPNFGECCHACKADPACMAWTRVAGEPFFFFTGFMHP